MTTNLLRLSRLACFRVGRILMKAIFHFLLFFWDIFAASFHISYVLLYRALKLFLYHIHCWYFISLTSPTLFAETFVFPLHISWICQCFILHTQLHNYSHIINIIYIYYFTVHYFSFFRLFILLSLCIHVFYFCE